MEKIKFLIAILILHLHLHKLSGQHLKQNKINLIQIKSSNLLPLLSRPLRQISSSSLSNHKPMIYTIPITSVIQAERVNDYNQIQSTKQNLAIQKSLLLIEEIIDTIINSIDVTEILKVFDNISLGKLLKRIYIKTFPHGIYNAIKEFLKPCDGATHHHYEHHETIPTTTHQPSFPFYINHPTIPTTTQKPSHQHHEHPSTTPLTTKLPTHSSAYTNDQINPITEKIKELAASVVSEPMNIDIDYDHEIEPSDISDLRETPVTDDYIEDQTDGISENTTEDQLQVNEMKSEISRNETLQSSTETKDANTERANRRNNNDSIRSSSWLHSLIYGR